MRIYMLNPPFVPRFSRNSRWAARCRGGALYYPIWLSYACGVLETQKHNVRFVDAPARGIDIEHVKDDVRNFKPDLIVSESNFQSLSNDLLVARELKTVADKISVVVGPPASQFPERLLNEGADIVARFEYDLTIKEIAESLENGAAPRNIKGISYKENGKIIHNPDRKFTSSEELDSIPFVSKIYKKHLNINDYFLGHTLYPMVQIFTGRGCPNQCTFCSWPETLLGRTYRGRSTKNVVDELEYIANELKDVKEIFIEDDTFTVNKKRIRDVCAEIKGRKLDITWSCNARANLDHGSMQLMKEAGCRLLDVGYESGNDEILKNIKKDITTEESRRFTADAKKAGLMILADFIFGMPGETKETAEETIRFVKEIKPNIAQFSVATPIPGTKFHEWVSEHGFSLETDLEKSLDKDGYQRCIISYPEFSNKDIETFVDRALKEYYLSPSYIPIFLNNVFRKNGVAELKNTFRSGIAFINYLKRQ